MKSRKLTPVVSVIIPVHGEAPHLVSTLRSIQEQDFNEFETLVVLDRVSNNVETYVRNLASNSENFKVLVSKLPGISNALNLGINECSGEFIARIDADDLMRKDRLTLQKTYLEINQEVVCVGSQVTKINVDGIQIGKSNYPISNKQIIKTLLFRNCMAHPSVMYRRSAIIQLGGYRNEFNGAEDYDLWLRMMFVGKIVNMNEHLTYYRIWANQVTRQDKDSLVTMAGLARRDFHASLETQEKLGISKNGLLIRRHIKSTKWINAADLFNTAIAKMYEPGEHLASIKSLVKTLRLTPLLATQISFGLFWRHIISRFKRKEK